MHVNLATRQWCLWTQRLGINVEPGDVDRAIEAMLKAGAEQATNDDFPDAVDNLPLGGS